LNHFDEKKPVHLSQKEIVRVQVCNRSCLEKTYGHRTIVKALKTLEKRALVNRPLGPRSGYQITKHGRETYLKYVAC
jgi:hypothetical protein